MHCLPAINGLCAASNAAGNVATEVDDQLGNFICDITSV